MENNNLIRLKNIVRQAVDTFNTQERYLIEEIWYRKMYFLIRVYWTDISQNCSS